MYTIDIKQSEKIFLVTASGFIRMDEAKQCIQTFKENLAKINPREYNIIIDAKDQKTVSTEVQELLAEVAVLYVKTPFKSHHTIMFNSAVTKTQVARVNAEFGNKFKFHDTLAEAIKSCK